MPEKDIRAIFSRAITNEAFKTKFENPETRLNALRDWYYDIRLTDDELDMLLNSKATKLSDIAVDFDYLGFFKD